MSKDVIYCGQALPVYGRRLAPDRGQLLSPDLTKGGLSMVTYADMFTYSLVIIGIIGLVLGAKKQK